MPGIRRTRDRQGELHPTVRFWFTDWTGKRRWATGTTSEPETMPTSVW